MTTRKRPGRAEELLFERERQGVRLLTLVRALFVTAMMVIHWVVGVSMFEKMAATALWTIWVGVYAGFLLLLARRRAVGTVGLAGSLMDVIMLAAWPWIWYVSVGGESVPPAYMLKTQLAVTTLAFIALNAIALRPLYPIVVATGAILIHAVLLIVILQDPRTIVSSNFLDSVMGPALSLEYVASAIFTFAVAGGAIGYVTVIGRRTVAQAVRLEVSNAQLGRYFSPGVVSRIAADDEDLLGPGGRTQDVAVMFCDIRDFTGLSESLPPADVIDLLSGYHARMVGVIFAHGGTVDKFIGDAIMATFGTPDTAADDVERSVRAGIAMNVALAELNENRRGEGQSEIRHGIGIHFGSVIAGNVGTEERLEYTVIGDTVNVASRIQDACKTLGESFLISEAVEQRLPSDISRRPMAEQQLRGREVPVRLYAVDTNPPRPREGAASDALHN